MKIDYLSIIKKAFSVTWNNKYLWWFGFFIILGSGFGMNYSFPGNGSNSFSLPSNFLENKIIILVGIAFVLATLIFVVFISIRGRAALIASIGKIIKNQSSNFKNGFKEGENFFWLLLAARIIIGFVIFWIVIVLLMPILFLFSSKAIISGVIVSILAVFIVTAIIILSYFVRLYTDIYIVLGGLKIRDAFEKAYLLFRKNVAPSILMALFFIFLNLIFFIIILGIILMLLITLGPVGIVLYFIFSKIGAIIIFIIAIIIFVISVVILNSIYNVFSQAVWVLFFNEIGRQKKEETIQEKEIEAFEGKIPNPEEA
jgi:hypothetical protein